MDNADSQKGREALQYYHNQSRSYSNYPFLLSSDLENALGGFYFAEGLGLAAYNLSSAEMRSAMVNFAKQGQGRMPANKNSFFKAISDQATNFSWIDATKYVATETAKDVGKGAVVVGDSVIAAGKNLFAILPIIVVVGLGLFVYLRVKK